MNQKICHQPYITSPGRGVPQEPGHRVPVQLLLREGGEGVPPAGRLHGGHRPRLEDRLPGLPQELRRAQLGPQLPQGRRIQGWGIENRLNGLGRFHT